MDTSSDKLARLDTRETESLLITAQNKSIRTKYIKASSSSPAVLLASK